MDGIEATPGAPDGASTMQAVIADFNSQGGGDPAPAATPTPDPPAAPADQTPADQQPAEDAAPGWYDALMAADQQQPDELATFLNDETFNGLGENPAGLVDWAQKARGHLQKFNEGAERERTLSASVERIGGWEDAPKAFDLYGDLYRGDIALSESDRAEYPEAQTYAERALLRVMGQDKGTAYSLGAAVLNLMPEILTHNAGYLLKALGYDPKYAEDYKRVAEAGGFQITQDQQAIQEWFKGNNVPLDQLTTLNSLPIKVQQDILAGNPEAGKFHLQRYHNDRINGERTAKAEEERRGQEVARAEYQSLQTLAGEQRNVFQEYIDKGKALGLNPLEAAGLAAMAYRELEEQYWDENSESRRVLDDWHGRIKTGNKLQREGGRAGYRKAFETSWRRAAGQYAPKRPGVPPNPKEPKEPKERLGGNQPQFTPVTPPDEKLNGLTGGRLMEQILLENATAFPAR